MSASRNKNITSNRGEMSIHAETYAKNLMSHFQHCDRGE
ncbi:hypothetical protein GXM_08226 [Nostoc sphaeroides CCNUC1]|uniref:Uncharacterized protein n=1 Tax=Nostoc sphaeroides CCNUC1 TaxID=2653204 RepID=A0A5P8WDW4_9NOSO|nr:hypothetical protein GXM_08226 [Nostoc sphaeroides CCNUC1]